MPKKKINRKAPRPQKRQSKFASRPATMQSPSFEKLQKVLGQMTPHIQAAGFNGFVLVGYRRIPEGERKNYKGADEVPFYFYNFPHLEEAGALIDWASEDVRLKIVNKASQGPPPTPPEKEKDEK